MKGRDGATMKALTVTLLRIPELPVETASNPALAEALNRAVKQCPALQGDRLLLPESGNPQIVLSLYGTGNPAVIRTDGAVSQPLEDMAVSLFYRAADRGTGEMLEADEPVVVQVSGAYDGGAVNRPQVLPSIREWKGEGDWRRFSGRIVVNDPQLAEAADQIRFAIEQMAGLPVVLEPGEALAGDLEVALDPALPLGKEGYALHIADTVKVRAASPVGALYAGATLSQMLMGAPDRRTLPKGMMRDYPQYPIRGFMIDTARYYLSLPYLEEITKYVAFFKVNQIHLHLNDGAGETVDSFRLQSERYPALNKGIAATCRNGGDKLYGKEDFRRYQKKARALGITIVPEIDAPSHCGTLVSASQSAEAAARGFTNAGINTWQLDLRDDAFDNSVRFVQSVFDEYLDGEDPVFVGERVHIGTDEWLRDSDLESFGMTRAERNEQMRRYMDAMIRYLDAKGRVAVLWNGMNRSGVPYGGETPVSNKALFQFWSAVFSSLDIVKAGKYPIINSFDADLYIVPGVDYYKNEFDLPAMYREWRVGRFGNDLSLPEGHPVLQGAEASLWLDANAALSHTDLFRLLKSQMLLVTEKAWYGAGGAEQSAGAFLGRIARLAEFAPGANPGRYVPADPQGRIALLDFSHIEGRTVRDLSGNGFNAALEGRVETAGSALLLRGETRMVFPFKTLAEPYRAELEIRIDPDTPEGAELFGGEDGRLYLSGGRLFYERKGYAFRFDCPIPTARLIRLEISGDEQQAVLRLGEQPPVAGDFVSCEYENGPGKRFFHTFQLPLERVGAGIRGQIRALRLYRAK